ncbi:MAG TPA: heme ABC exporter ATP-binding protein CcmA [Candidatus Nitrosotalea sp.]|nr:heme ABC exporter ATP-binding protein CcmA [Candidatus Nitrosotalea sp.]
MRAVLGHDLTQTYGAGPVLGPLDLELEEGEHLALLGPNGSGKTTLLRILATLARPATGALQILGHDALAQRQLVRPRIGYLGHQSGVQPQLSALENLEFYAALYHLEPERARAALAEVGLEAVSGRRARELSRGMEQRLALARALLHDPELVFLDEPDASLDVTARELLGRLLAGRAAVIATHDRALAASLCGRELELGAGGATRPRLGTPG